MYSKILWLSQYKGTYFGRIYEKTDINQYFKTMQEHFKNVKNINLMLRKWSILWKMIKILKQYQINCIYWKDHSEVENYCKIETVNGCVWFFDGENKYLIDFNILVLFLKPEDCITRGEYVILTTNVFGLVFKGVSENCKDYDLVD